ncbi:MAG: sigma-70 family RNA polymerase sigma factor [Phycisphaerales bacterium]|nr:sigma-70 family RNA polymerase sigma factor [Phycisphaerales bacterium]
MGEDGAIGRADSGDSARVTRLLGDLASGKQASSDELLPLVYEQLRRAAQQRMAQERTAHTLTATALVHEAYARLVGDEHVKWDGRGHFYAAAAEAMRRILIEHARARGRVKRGGGRQRVPLSVVDLATEADAGEIMALDGAIERLRGEDERLAEIVRLRFYAGLSVEETAAALGVSERTVKRDWAFARAWLHRELEEGEPRRHGDTEGAMERGGEER